MKETQADFGLVNYVDAIHAKHPEERPVLSVMMCRCAPGVCEKTPPNFGYRCKATTPAVKAQMVHNAIADQRPEWATKKPCGCAKGICVGPVLKFGYECRRADAPKPHIRVKVPSIPATLDADSDGKLTNPKDDIGSTKLPMGIVPSTIQAHVALSFLEGALKYGRYNWRIAGVRASIYADALQRHFAKWWNGENVDKKTRVRHLASIIASAGILLDAELSGKLNDDRPPASPEMGKLIDESEEVVKHLLELFKDHKPKQYTIADSQ